MPLFYFHLRGPQGLDRDETGLERACVEDAYLEAFRAVLGMGADLVADGRNPLRYAFEITDDRGTLLMDLPFSEVLDRGRKPARPPSGARSGSAAAEMARTADLIAAIAEERDAAWAKLAETRRLLVLLRPVKPCGLVSRGLVEDGESR